VSGIIELVLLAIIGIQFITVYFLAMVIYYANKAEGYCISRIIEAQEFLLNLRKDIDEKIKN